MISYQEIPKANFSNGDQDTFELFARDFLKLKGFDIVTDPARGADDGVDLIVREQRQGENNELVAITWLVSCKHYAHSGRSVSVRDEIDIIDRVKSHNCDGFIAFYSTLPSSGLSKKLSGLKEHIFYQVYDNKKIEHEIIGFSSMENLFMRYFPESYRKWKYLINYREPTELFQFYLENKLKFEADLFMRVFGSSDNILRAIRNSNDFESFIKYSSVDLFMENTDEQLDNLIRLYDPKRKSLGQSLIKDLQYLNNEVLTPFLSDKYSINLVKGSILLEGRNYMRGDKDGTLLLYPNALFLNEPEYKGQKELYEKLVQLV